MPAKDRYHDVVVRAVRKAGWSNVEEHVALTMPTRRVWIDIRASKGADAVVILVEVKRFERLPSAEGVPRDRIVLAYAGESRSHAA